MSTHSTDDFEQQENTPATSPAQTSSTANNIDNDKGNNTYTDKKSILIQIPIAAFILVIITTTLVSVLFYGETERLLKKQITNELAVASNLVEPMLEQLYSQVQSDVLFLSRIPPVKQMLTSTVNSNEKNYLLGKMHTEQTFNEFISHKPFYYQVRYIGVADDGQELINVRHQGVPLVRPKPHLPEIAKSSYFLPTITKAAGKVHFSKIELAKIELAKSYGEIELPHKAILRASTPIYDPISGEVFGLIIINVNFGEYWGQYIDKLKEKEFSQLSIYLANNEGDFISHPDKSKTFGFDLGQRYLIQDEFPTLFANVNNQVNAKLLINEPTSLNNILAHYQQIELKQFAPTHPLNLLLRKDSTEIENILSEYKIHSLLIGIVLTLISLFIAFLACRKLVSPIQGDTNSLEKHEKSNTLKQRPLENIHPEINAELPAKSGDTNNFSQYQALLVEDNRINQEVARHVLLGFSINPDIANNGIEAIEKLKQKKYDVIFMDCQMPEMDGYQATAAIRKGEAGEILKDVLIIAMTANVMKGDKEKCLAAGMTDYLSKPIEAEKINEKLSLYLMPSKLAPSKLAPTKLTPSKVNSLMNNENMVDVPEATTQESTLAQVQTYQTTNVDSKRQENKLQNVETVAFAQTNDDEKLAVWQQEAFNKRLNGNKEIQKKLIELFLESVPEQLEELAASILQKDIKQQRAISHKLQGMSANLSAEEFLHQTKLFNEYLKVPSPESNVINTNFKAMQLSYESLEQQLKEELSD